MQRSWLQWVAAGDQWYLNKLGMECCLIYQGEPSLTWVGMPGDISFPWVLNCCGQQDTNSWDSWITQGLYTRLEWEFGIACTWQTVLLNITAVTGSVLLHGHAPGKTASAGETWGSLLHLLLAPFFFGGGEQRKEKNEHWRDLVCSMALEMLFTGLLAILLFSPHPGGWELSWCLAVGQGQPTTDRYLHRYTEGPLVIRIFTLPKGYESGL